MGCDIHAGVEVLTRPFERYQAIEWWQMAGEILIERDYAMFAALAGVRSEVVADRGEIIVPIADPRGLPETVSAPMKGWWSSWGEDAHSASWVTPQELEEAAPYFDFTGIIEAIWVRAAVYNAIDARLVFFFDN